MKISEKYKNILFCSISHELRSPVNHINGILELIKNATGDEDIIQYVCIANSSWEILLNKINDILDFSLLETNTIQLKSDKVEVRLLLNEIQNILSYQFDHKSLNLSIFVSENVPKVIIYDKDRLKQILLNLSFNAVKYTSKGFVTIVVDCKFINQPESSKLCKYEFSETISKHWNLSFLVSDSGWGIDKRKRMNLFELFSGAKTEDWKIRNDKDVIKSSELMGIGLAFCQKMLQNMGSKLKLSTAVNVGSTFSFEIKVEYGQESGFNENQYDPSLIKGIKLTPK